MTQSPLPPPVVCPMAILHCSGWKYLFMLPGCLPVLLQTTWDQIKKWLHYSESEYLSLYIISRSLYSVLFPGLFWHGKLLWGCWLVHVHIIYDWLYYIYMRYIMSKKRNTFYVCILYIPYFPEQVTVIAPSLHHHFHFRGVTCSPNMLFSWIYHRC